MRFDITDLRLFVAVVEAGSITHGASRANLALGSASGRIKQDGGDGRRAASRARTARREADGGGHTLDAICRLVENGVGVSVVPESAARRCKRTMSIKTLELRDDWARRDGDTHSFFNKEASMSTTISAYRQIGDKRFREISGLYFEDFEPGNVYEHRPGRTITDVDNIWMTLLTMNTQQVHFDAEYATKTEWKKLLVDSTFTLALLTGMSVRTVSAKVVANLGWDKVRASAPVFAGDTLYAESTVLSRRESKSRPTQGIVTVETKGVNQHGVVVMSFERTMLIYKRGHSPEADANY